MSISAGFETGVNGNNVLATDSGDATAWDSRQVTGSATLTYDTTHVAHDSLAAKISNAGAWATMIWTTAFGTQTDHYGRIYLYFTANPSGRYIPMVLWNGGWAVNLAARLDIGNTGLIILRDSTSDIATASVAISLNQWIRLEYHVIHSATVGQFEVKLFNSADSSTTTDTITSAANKNTLANANAIEFGLFSGSSTTTSWMDKVVAAATSYPGPAGALPPTLRTITSPLRW